MKNHRKMRAYYDYDNQTDDVTGISELGDKKEKWGVNAGPCSQECVGKGLKNSRQSSQEGESITDMRRGSLIESHRWRSQGQSCSSSRTHRPSTLGFRGGLWITCLADKIPKKPSLKRTGLFCPQLEAKSIMVGKSVLTGAWGHSSRFIHCQKPKQWVSAQQPSPFSPARTSAHGMVPPFRMGFPPNLENLPSARPEVSLLHGSRS